MKKIVHLNNNYFEQQGTGKIVSVLESGVYTRIGLLQDIVYFGFGAFITIIGSLFFIWDIGIIPLLCALFFLVFSILLFYLLNRKVTKYKRLRKDLIIQTSRSMTKIIMSKFEVQLNNKIDYESSTLNRLAQQIIGYYHKEKWYLWSMNNVPEFILGFAKVVIILVIGIGAVQWTYTPGEFVIFMAVLSKLEGSVHDVLRFMMRFSQQYIDIEKLIESIDKGPETVWFLTWKTSTLNKGNITLEKLSYSYGDSKLVFSDFSLVLQGKKKTALVGPSWGGKSTLIKLIAWYLTPDKWEIIVDNQKLSEVSLQSYYQHIWYLTQDPSIFDGTIRENLLYAIHKDDAPSLHESLDEIIKQAKCERIYDLSQWLDTEIGERGVRLSWGQKQRLAIAKIMLKNPNIVLLDEPTSALDSYNEEQVTQALNTLFKNKTVIVVAHRLQTVKHADDIIYIADWKVVERGTHEELLKLKWEYYKMVELQSGF